MVGQGEISPCLTIVLALLACLAGALFLVLITFLIFLLPYIVDVFNDGNDRGNDKNYVSYIVHSSTSFLYFNYTKSIYNRQ